MTRISDLSLSSRVRSILAVRNGATWTTARESAAALCYEEAGTPMLIVNAEAARELIDSGAGKICLDEHPLLGVVELSGQFWSVAGRHATETLDALRREHLDCLSCPAWDMTHIIGLQVVTVAIRTPQMRDFAAVSIDDFELAEANELITLGAQLANHLNAAHDCDLADLVEAVTDRTREDLLAIHVDGIDGAQMTLSVVDIEGAQQVAVPLSPPLTCPRDLPDAIHRLIESASARSGRDSRPR